MITVLIVEDEPLIALDLRSVLVDAGIDNILMAATLRQARPLLVNDVDFVFLDVNVVDSTSYDLGRELTAAGVPYAFTSGSNPEDVPRDLRLVPFIRKPWRDKQLLDAVWQGMGKKGGQVADAG